MRFYFYNQISSLATSTGSYVDIFLSPNVQLTSSFNATNDCRFDGVTATCSLIITQTPNYLQLTVRGSTTYLAGTPNPFAQNTWRYISFFNLFHPRTTSNKYFYPVYLTLYKADVVNPTTYYSYTTVNAMPYFNELTGISFSQSSNYYASSSYYNYPGFLRFSSSNFTQLSQIILQAN